MSSNCCRCSCSVEAGKHLDFVGWLRLTRLLVGITLFCLGSIIFIAILQGHGYSRMLPSKRITGNLEFAATNDKYSGAQLSPAVLTLSSKRAAVELARMNSDDDSLFQSYRQGDLNVDVHFNDGRSARAVDKSRVGRAHAHARQARQDAHRASHPPRESELKEERGISEGTVVEVRGTTSLQSVQPLDKRSVAVTVNPRRRDGAAAITMTTTSPSNRGALNELKECGSTQAKHGKRGRLAKCFRILLIVIFNLPHYQNIAHLKRLYRDAFHDIVFYGSGVGDHSVPEVQQSPDHGQGFYQHRTVVTALRAYPNYDGYLWIGDDVWLNYPALLQRMNPEKIWHWKKNGTCPMYPTKEEEAFCNTAIGFFYSSDRQIIQNGLKRLPRRYVAIFNSTLQGRIMKQPADIIYLPKRFAADFVNLAKLWWDVTFEIAVPMALHLISSPSDRRTFHLGRYLWYDGKRRRTTNFWSPDIAFLHPVKFSKSALRELSMQWMERSKARWNYTLPSKYRCCQAYVIHKGKLN